MSRRTRRTYTEEFKKQMVDLFNAGKARAEIIREYELTPSAFNKWVAQFNNTKSFKHQDNLTELEKENIKLKKQLQEAKMEVDILKQAALIMGQKRKS